MTNFGGVMTASKFDPVRRAGGYRAWLEKLTALRWGPEARVDWNAAGAPVQAWVLRSYWVADCATPNCKGNVRVEPGEGFWCPDCGNPGNDNRARPVEWPDAARRAEIEATLLRRRDPNTRNWLLSETVEDLRQENLEHGEPTE